ncbi:MAG: MBL fold metallo-hydrolase [Candidatus Aenigmatarchaeota archaeon]
MTVLDEILAKLPKDAGITSSNYEGANIVLYTKNKTFFLHGGDIIRQIVSEVKKRIDLRADDSLKKSEEKTEKFIRETIPAEAEITQVLFESARSIVTIEAKKPGFAIGKEGEILKRIKEETFWTPTVRRESAMPSKITTNIRNVLFTESDYRRKFLHNVGKRIYEQRKSTAEDMWARVSILGAGREVGRSCFLLQTPESKVLIDCGLNIAATGRHAYPYLNVPEFNIEDLDAVIISHAHLDHCGFLPYLYKMGYKGPTYLTEPTRDIMALLALDYVELSHV